MITEKMKSGRPNYISAHCDTAMSSVHSGSGAAQVAAYFLWSAKYSRPQCMQQMIIKSVKEDCKSETTCSWSNREAQKKKMRHLGGKIR